MKTTPEPINLTSISVFACGPCPRDVRVCPFVPCLCRPALDPRLRSPPALQHTRHAAGAGEAGWGHRTDAKLASRAAGLPAGRCSAASRCTSAAPARSPSVAGVPLSMERTHTSPMGPEVERRRAACARPRRGERPRAGLVRRRRRGLDVRRRCCTHTALTVGLYTW